MWEYKTEVIKADKSFWGGKFDGERLDGILNDLGAQGWELVSFTAVSIGYGETARIIAVFKRQKEAQ
jgi:hypothetical protein